ncbi:hypothetical protein JOM56_010426 [Amanita muscaria]
MSPLLKLPFIVITNIAIQIISTSPNASIPDKERAYTGVFDKFLPQATKFMTTASWIVAFAEMAQILAGYIWGNENEPSPLYLTPASIFGTLFIVMGAYTRRQCYRTLGSMFTFEVTIQKQHKLVKHGPYSIVRHPSYTGSCLVFVGRLLWYFSRGSFLRETTNLAGRALAVAAIIMFTYIIITLLIRLPTEDELLRKRFGKEWEDWAKRVPYRLIPYVY